MQIFGKYSTNFDMDYSVEQYIYFNESDEDEIMQLVKEDIHKLFTHYGRHYYNS